MYKPTRSSEVIAAKFLSTTEKQLSDIDQQQSSTITNDVDRFTSSTVASADSKELEPVSREAAAELSSDENTNKLDATLPTHFENPHELETAYTNTKGDSSEGTKNIRQADNATNNVWKIDPSNGSSTSNEDHTSTSETPASSTANYHSTTEDNEDSVSASDETKAKRDPVVFVVDHSGQTKSIVVIDADGLQKVDEPIEDTNESKANRKGAATEKVFIVHANTEQTMATSSSTDASFEHSSSTFSTTLAAELDGQVFETRFYDLATSSPFDAMVSKEMIFGETQHSTRGPFPLSSSEENVQSDGVFGDMSTSGFVVLDSVTDRSSAASQHSFESELYGTEGPGEHVSYDVKYYSGEQVEGSSSPYEYSPFGRLSTALNEGTSEPTMDIASGDVESEDELSNPFESPEFPIIPDDLTIHGMMDDDHDVIGGKQQPLKEQRTERPASERILLDVLPLRSNGSMHSDNESAEMDSMASEDWLKSSDEHDSNGTSDETQLQLQNGSEHSSTVGPTDGSSTTDDISRSSSFSDEYYASSNSEDAENTAATGDSSKQQFIEDVPASHNFLMEAAKDLLRLQNKFFIT